MVIDDMKIIWLFVGRMIMLLLWVKSVCKKNKWKVDMTCWLRCLWMDISN